MWVQKWPTSTPLTLGGNAFASGYSYDGTSPYDPSRSVVATSNVTVSGGDGNYSYTWAYVSGDTFAVSNPNSLNTNFTATVPRNASRTGVYRLTATSAGQTATKDVTVSCLYEGGPPV